jgi:hypothetical protein
MIANSYRLDLLYLLRGTVVADIPNFKVKLNDEHQTADPFEYGIGSTKAISNVYLIYKKGNLTSEGD